MVPIGVKWFLTRSGPCATNHLEAGGFIRSKEGISHPNIQYHFLPAAFTDHGRVPVDVNAFQVSTAAKVKRGGLSYSGVGTMQTKKNDFLFKL